MTLWNMTYGAGKGMWWDSFSVYSAECYQLGKNKAKPFSCAWTSNYLRITPHGGSDKWRKYAHCRDHWRDYLQQVSTNGFRKSESAKIKPRAHGKCHHRIYVGYMALLSRRQTGPGWNARPVCWQAGRLPALFAGGCLHPRIPPQMVQAPLVSNQWPNSAALPWSPTIH